MLSDNANVRQRRFFTAAILAVLWLALCSLVPAVYAKDNPDDFTRVYSHSYDEVWDATHEVIERAGWFVTSEDKDKGTISGNGLAGNPKNTFTLHIETVSPKPETRVTIDVKWNQHAGAWGARKREAHGILARIQTILATYR